MLHNSAKFYNLLRAQGAGGLVAFGQKRTHLTTGILMPSKSVPIIAPQNHLIVKVVGIFSSICVVHSRSVDLSTIVSP